MGNDLLQWWVGHEGIRYPARFFRIGATEFGCRGSAICLAVPAKDRDTIGRLIDRPDTDIEPGEVVLTVERSAQEVENIDLGVVEPPGHSQMSSRGCRESVREIEADRTVV